MPLTEIQAEQIAIDMVKLALGSTAIDLGIMEARNEAAAKALATKNAKYLSSLVAALKADLQKI